MGESHSEQRQFSRGILFPLRNGRQVLVGPVLPEDKDRIRHGLTRMSESSRYLRFFLPIPQLTDQQLHTLTHVDQFNHVAWAALDPFQEHQPGLGLGRFVRLDKEPRVAEFALAVIDEVQQQGLGTILLATLFIKALGRDLDALRGLVLPEHTEFIAWLHELGASSHLRKDLDILQMDLPVQPDLAAIAPTPSGHRFRQIFQRLWDAGIRP